MVFITRCCARFDWGRFRTGLLALLLCLPVWAGTIKLDSADGTERDGRLGIDARFQVALDPVHESALLQGIPLTFAVEFTLTRPRWYWAVHRVGDWFEPSARLEFKLAYHSLTRTYRVSVGSLYQSYDTLSDALRALGVVRDWAVAERGGFTRKLGSRFAGELSMRLDISQLPRPMQLSLLGDADWKLESGQTVVEFTEGSK